MLRILHMLAGVLCLALVAACSDGKSGQSQAEIDATTLSDMVLRPEQLGVNYAGSLIGESTRYPNQQVVRESLDQAKAAQDLQKYGRIDGYTLIVVDSRRVPAAATTVNLHKEAKGASEFHALAGTDIKSGVGKTREDQSQLVAAESFSPRKIGDEADGLVLAIKPPPTASGPKPTVYQTVVGFRRGRILGTAVVFRTDDSDARDEAVRIAKLLDERIEAVLKGKE
jgi:hypothetical protein